MTLKITDNQEGRLF